VCEGYLQRRRKWKLQGTAVRTSGDNLPGSQAFAAGRQEVGQPAQGRQRMPRRMTAVEIEKRAIRTLDRQRESIELRFETAGNNRPNEQSLVGKTIGQFFGKAHG